MTRITLSLVSHTNVGKTTLARTLLGQDVGEVRDAPHVTEFAEPHRVLATEAGDELWLWDTPGFGDSVRLARRMRQSGNPLGWVLSQVWDRFTDRPFWASQQALRNVREQADVVLYLVNAAEPPESAGYVAPEMDLLEWLGKPVIVLLNQLGAPRPLAEEAVDVDRWRQHLALRGGVRAVLAFDAFARCWVQEGVLLAAIAAALPGAQRGAMEGLQAAWQASRRQVFADSMAVLARSLAVMALDRQPVDDGSFLDGVRTQLREIGSRVRGDPSSGPVARAEQLLAEGLDREVRASTARLIALHGLEGEARDEVLKRLAARYDLRLRVDEGQAAVVGGVVTGALAGLKADLATGGLTLGGGLLAGSLLGALGGLGVARLVNRVRGTGRSWVTWNAAVLDGLVAAALLRYLAVAHFGRGRGEWRDGEVPPHWPGVVDRALASSRDSLAALWAARLAGGDDALDEAAIRDLASRLEPLLAGAAAAALQDLYPGLGGAAAGGAKG
ncbi:MAG: GTPase domain-containing protein [Chromatiales bacterium]|jgi:hypothetical protein|nr:GTPase domain-containing protein [Chromatiales bacterium]